MKRIRRSLLIGCIALFVCGGLFAQNEKDSISGDVLRVSLLTCSSGDVIYELFGHTALRVQDAARGMDLVFNYGVFDFDTPNFVWRFVKGETDYELGVVPFNYFVASYVQRNSSVTEQVLNLDSAEKVALLNALKENALPENRVYRYNFLFDNCSTRPRIKVEEAVNGLIKYDENIDIETFRSIIHQYTKGHPWAQFGMDLCLGSGADRELGRMEKMFVPSNLYEAFRRSVIVPVDGEIRDLVLHDEVIAQVDPAVQKSDGGISPFLCGVLLLLFVIVISVYGVVRGYSFWGVDVVLFGMAGIVGCVLAFLAFFSEHPAVQSNWNMCVFHPFHLLYLPFYIYNARKKEKDYYHVANFIVLTFFLLFMGVLPQKINIAILWLLLSLWFRSGCYTLLTADRWK